MGEAVNYLVMNDFVIISDNEQVLFGKFPQDRKKKLQIQLVCLGNVKVEKQKHQTAFFVEMAVFKVFASLFNIVNHAANQPLLNQQFFFFAFLQRGAFQFNACNGKISIRITVFVIPEIDFLHHLAQTAFAFSCFIIRSSKITKRVSEQAFAVFENRSNVCWIVLFCHVFNPHLIVLILTRF